MQRGDGRWQVHIRHTDEDGRSRRYTVYGSTPKEARAKASAVRERLRANLPARDRKVTLGAFAAEWIDSTLAASDRKASTKAMYATMARQHIIGSKIGAQPLDKLRPSHIEAWKVELEHRGLSESTIRSAYTILRAVLDTAVRGLQGQGRQSPRRQQVLPIALAGEHTRDGLLVAYPLRHRDSLDGPESEQRRSPLVVRRSQEERRRLDRSLLRPPSAIGRGEQLARDRTRERLLPDVPLLHPHRAAVGRHVVTARYRADLTTLIGDAPMKASRAATSWELHIS